MLRVIFAAVLALGTIGAWVGSARGLGLPGMMSKPVSIRQESTQRSARGPHFLYFGLVGRRHSGGGFRGGK